MANSRDRPVRFFYDAERVKELRTPDNRLPSIRANPKGIYDSLVDNKIQILRVFLEEHHLTSKLWTWPFL